MRNGRTLGAVAVLVASAVMGAGAAAADTFTYTGGEQSYTVPAGITGLHVVLVGAAGAAVGQPGGYGAELTADIPAPAGTTTLYVEVGGKGGLANPPTVAYSATGGFNGGGSGEYGGGGASDIRTVSDSQPNSLSSRLAVAGGGGGAGTIASMPFDEGNAGNADGSGNAGGNYGGTNISDISGGGATVGGGGQPADQSTVTTYCLNNAPDKGGELGLAGGLGSGGSGAYLFISGTATSGGGGGGLYGGAGGAQCYDTGATADGWAGAGGGGSSGAPGGGQNVQITTDATDPAEVIITTPVPISTAPPSLSGGLTVGDVAAESHATWSSGPAVSGYAYRWERCDSGGAACAAIAGATAQTYRLAPADVGHTLRVRETVSNFYGPASTPATSAASGVVIGEPPTTIDPPTVAYSATGGFNGGGSGEYGGGGA
ncbi:MAG TPA: hypothetical protein VE127_17500, partial [Solirubrobacteraceae bacterium]|nr:hypothetical protein [Solirubrobacteraceae bacterium]